MSQEYISIELYAINHSYAEFNTWALEDAMNARNSHNVHALDRVYFLEPQKGFHQNLARQGAIDDTVKPALIKINVEDNETANQKLYDIYQILNQYHHNIHPTINIGIHPEHTLYGAAED
ncbi:MAG: hypothetical protein AAFY76_18185, partial [Cyanobacteria bacterium J06649_11]